MGQLKEYLKRRASVYGAAVAPALMAPAAFATTVTVDIGSIHDQSWDLSEGIAAVGAVALALAGLFLVVKVVKSVFAAIV